MSPLFKVLFLAVAAALLAKGIQNLLWTEFKEQRRFRVLVSRGLAAHMLANGLSVLLFGGLISFASMSVPFAFAWQSLGAAIVVVGSTMLLVSRFGSVATPSIEQMPTEIELRKRVNWRRTSGALFAIGGVVWLWNGVPVALA